MYLLLVWTFLNQFDFCFPLCQFVVISLTQRKINIKLAWKFSNQIKIWTCTTHTQHSSNFWVCWQNPMVGSDGSNETSSTVLLHGTICILIFCKIEFMIFFLNLWFFLEFGCLALLGNKWLISEITIVGTYLRKKVPGRFHHILEHHNT